ncbi:MAG: hypothetical protein JNL11_05400 [Bdellovibrionaceae bacterium]|nr:hypothetical protein [Pseudobdellovibrionaceae bacterium]
MSKLFFFFVLFYGMVFGQVNPQLKVSGIEGSYIPQGFDSNDNVQMVVEGVFKDTCSKPGPAQFAVNQATKTVEVLTTEYRYAGPCLDVLVPHDTVVNLGVLGQGTYRVMQKNGRQLGSLVVQQALRATADDYLYAPVSQVYLKNSGAQVSVTLSGSFSNSCMSMAQVLTRVQGNVIVVQPLAHYNKEASACANVLVPFEKTVIINGVRPGRYLLHIRSLNGNSVNNLYNIR